MIVNELPGAGRTLAIANDRRTSTLFFNGDDSPTGMSKSGIRVLLIAFWTVWCITPTGSN
jgi:hypothetical protein